MAYYEGYSAPVRARTSGAGIVALILGILSIFFNPFFVIGIIAIVLGRRERVFSAAANIGYICGWIGTVLWILAVVVWLGWIR